MTLKQFLKENNITLSNKEMCRLGNFIKTNDRNFPKIKEDGLWVNYYDKKFLEYEETQKKIIKFLQNT